RPQRLFHFLAAGGYQVEKRRDFSIEKIDVCGENAARGGVPGHGARADGRYPHVSDSRAASTGSHSGLSRSLVPTRIRVFGLMARSALVVSPLNPGVVPMSCFS